MTNAIPLRVRRLEQARKSLAATRETRERYIGMIARYTEAIKRLERKIARLEKPQSEKPRKAPMPLEQFSEVLPAAGLAQIAGDLPAFLDRRTPGELKDEAAKQEIISQQAERKRSKTNWRITKMKAKKAGDLRKMPLEGKAALEFINRG